jgi:hypothetical protein
VANDVRTLQIGSATVDPGSLHLLTGIIREDPRFHRAMRRLAEIEATGAVGS